RTDRDRSSEPAPQARVDGRRHRCALRRAGIVSRLVEARNLIPPRMQRSQAALFLVLGLVALGVVGEIVPLYTDWLWFQEVGYTGVFLTTLKLRGSLFTAVAVVVLVFLYGNLTFAARRARPDVLWELEDQLGLPGRVVIEPIIRRFLPVVLAFIAFASGLRASARWETLLQYSSAVPFGTIDPLFGRDLGFFVFTLPFWRMVVGWAPALVFGTTALTVRPALLALASLVQIPRGGRRLIAAGLLVLLGVWILGLGIYPALLQRFRVTPNELAAERPFIQHNIRMTRQAYGLDRVEEKEFPAAESLDARALERNAPTIKNIRLWDHRPLLRTFAQLEEL